MKRHFEIRKKFRRFLRRYINGTKGVISLFLAILMLPFVSVGGALLNAARVDSAIAIFDEALCNASNSTLGTYDSFLRTRFGLLAMSQDTSARGSGYTAQDLISETFQFYMEQNLAALSNTYVVDIRKDIDASGIYPLADTSVLLSEVLEYGKYAIPTKLVIDGLCINDIISTLSGNTKVAQSLLGTGQAAVTMEQKFEECQKKFDAACDKLDGYVTAKEKYVIAYSAFETAVNGYNDLVDERAQKILECDQAISSAEDAVSNAEDSLAEEDEDENPTAYSQAQSDLEDAETALEEAKDKREAVIQEYQGKLDTQRAAVESSKAAYIVQIAAFADAVKAAGEAIVQAQTAYTNLENAGTTLMTNVGGAVYELQKQSMDDQIKDMQVSQAAAKDRGDHTAEYLWGDQIDEAKEKKDEISADNTLLKAASGAEKEARDTMNKFAVQNYKDKFNEIYADLIALKGSVEGYTVESGYEAKMSAVNTDTYFDNKTTEPLSKSQIQDMMDELAGSIAKSTFFATIKAMIRFIQAIAKLNVFFDPELNATIDKSLFPGGELPSGKEPSRLTSAFEAKDSQKSDDYKKLLSSYSSGGIMQGNGMGADSFIEKMLEGISGLAKCFEEDWNWTNLFKKLGELTNAVVQFVTNIAEFVKNAATLLAEAVGQKILLTGYVAYNIPNRTTYKGTALTGSFYQLPSAGSAGQGYAFYGAETEYIMKGSLSEIANQTLVFMNVWMIRILLDVGFVVTNKEVSAIAQGAGYVSFGIGLVLIYAVFTIGEAYVDTLILVNGGKVSIWKGKLYLTPTGIPDLIKAFWQLPLSDDMKKQITEDAKEAVGISGGTSAAGGGGSGGVSLDKESSVAGGGMGSKVVDSLKFDYTKTLILAMLFENKEKMLNRLADVIQMEASYQAASGIGRYEFDLDQSYTYLRSSGSFQMNEFLPISDRTGIHSKERIIYKGY